jgi:hypothetical protein
MGYRRQLTDLYAKYPASEVTTQPEYAQLYADYGKESQFEWLRSQLQDMKAAVQAGVEKAASPKEQLQNAIHLLRSYRRRERERDLFYDLVVAICGPKWGAQRMADLDTALAAVRLQNDFFLSFTTRHSAPDINPVNARYKYFIEERLPNTFATKDQRRENLFAEAIYQIFCQKGAKGYYFPKSDDDTTIVIDELQRELNQSMVFVQIIQTELFQYSQKTNYCFQEWSWARGRFGNNEAYIVYISGEPDRTWADLPPDAPYLMWHLHASAKKVKPTPLHRLYDQQQIERTTQAFEDVLELDILGAWTRLELAAP